MKTLEAFKSGDGSHCGLDDWYDDKEAALKAALDAHEPFDTGWYSSKKEIASARIHSTDGRIIRVDVSVSDDFDTVGNGSSSTNFWTLKAIAAAIEVAWDKAEDDRKDNKPYIGFSIHNPKGLWIETYLLSNGEHDAPPGDNYHWWGWQHDERDDVGIPDPSIPANAVKAFEAYINSWDRADELTIDGWTIKEWRD